MLLHELSSARLLDRLAEMERLHREFSRILGPGGGVVAPEFPPTNVWTSEHDAIVTAEVPGVDPSDIDISVVNETITLRGIRKPDEVKNGAQYHRRERGYGQFTRTIGLPFRIDADRVQAKFCKGILQVRLPRTEQDKPRKITVKPE